MPVKIRLQRQGRRKAPYYHIVIADVRAPRDGKFIEKIGSYNPMTNPATIDLDREKAYDWLDKGAQPTDTARAILRFKGVLYRKHLMRGVKKGALTVEQADDMHQKWIDEKEAKVNARREEEALKKINWLAEINGKVKAVKHTPKADASSSASLDAPAAETGTFADNVEQTTVESFSSAPAAEATPEPAKEAPAAEKTPEPAKEAAPAAEKTPEPAKAAAPEAPAPVKEEVKEEEKVEAAAPAAPAPTEKPAAADDLKKIEGIGPKIAEILNGTGITTFAALAAASADSIKETLAKAEGNFAAHDPTTWPAQAKMAAAGEWDKLKVWQDELDGGKVVAKKEEEE